MIYSLVNLRCYTKQEDTAAPQWSHLSCYITQIPQAESKPDAGGVLKASQMVH